MNKYYRGYVKDSVESVFKGSKQISLSKFEQELSKHGISAKYATNSGGVYGVSFIHQEKNIKASDVDKDLSWNKMKERLEVPSYINEREQLKDSISKGYFINTKFDGKKMVFRTPNKVVEAKLNKINGWHAAKLRDLHNGYSEQIRLSTGGVNEKQLINDRAGQKIGAYLQNEHEINLARNQRQHKISW